MKKSFLFAFAFFITALAYSQTPVFQIGANGEILRGDTIKTWHRCGGYIGDSTCADYYTTGRISYENNWIDGEVKSYDQSKTLLFRSVMLNGQLNGKAFYYYPNGKLKESGTYINDKRRGIWRYFYDSGSVKQILNFKDSITEINAYYSQSGAPLVVSGNGHYEGTWSINTDCTEDYWCSGEVKDGKMEGSWEVTNLLVNQRQAVETYSDGKFITGKDITGGIYDRRAYKDHGLIMLSGYRSFEHLNWDNFQSGNCEHGSFQLIEYESKLYSELLYQDLINRIKSYPDLKNQWLIVRLDFDTKYKLKAVSIFSSKYDEKLTMFISKYMTTLKGNWRGGATSLEKHPAPVCFPVIINSSYGNENVLIPEEYRLRHTVH